MSKCEACTRGDHGNCSMGSWCECPDERDGDPFAQPDHVDGPSSDGDLPRPSMLSRHGNVPWEMHEACRGWGCVECEGMGIVAVAAAKELTDVKRT